MKILAALVDRLRQAYDNLPENRKPEVKALMLAAHQQALRARGLVGPDADARQAPSELSLAYSALFGDPALLAGPEEEEEPLPPYVDSNGVIWGFGKYQELDPGWLTAMSVWLESYGHKHPFGTTPAQLTIADDVTLALVGDWGTGQFGTGTAPPLQIAAVLKQHPPGYAIHLGDVYYAGTSAEENANVLANWARGSAGSFALNSNHEMYPGGDGYFGTLLGSSVFAAQRSTSYFSFTNSHWIVVGLDSAYYADYWTAFGDGFLDSTYQLPFLAACAQTAQQEGKGLIVLTHHNGLAANGTGPTTLWNQVTSVLPGGAGPVYWYWGHQHAGVVYPQTSRVNPRCLGHGALPWGYAKGFANQPTVTWFESKPNPVNPSLQVMNGFVLLALTGATLKEQFFDQTGNPAWTAAG